MIYKIPNTFHIEARCESLIEFRSVEELTARLDEIQQAREEGRLLIVGQGSNLLPTGDYKGVVVRSMMKGVEEKDGNRLRCASGESVDDVIGYAISKGLYGMENLSYIPGDVGASAVQNIGAYGAEAKDFITTIEAMEIETGLMVTIQNEECHYAYRHSLFKTDWKNRYVITHVTYQLSREFCPRLEYGNIRAVLEEKNIETPTAEQLRDVIIAIRKAKLPEPDELGNAGSFFMNPIVPIAKYEELKALYPNMPHYPVDGKNEKIPAGWLIEQSGWKGKALGRAGVHDKQALVLVNLGGAEGKEVVALCERVCHDVKQQFGIEIRPEVNII